MRMYVTGATGFVGSYVVAEALRRGHDVVAVVRPSSTTTVGPSPAGAEADQAGGSTSGSGSNGSVIERGTITEARVDLRSTHGLADSLKGVDMVIHLAAAKSGDFYTQFAGTVVATENLLQAMDEAEVPNLVGISTFSVYDYMSLKQGTVLDERSPIDTAPELRDEYARTKLIQEALYRDFGAVDHHHVVIVRPGMIYGPDNLWHALLGADVGSRFLRIGTKAVLPLTYVENCADAIVLAAEGLPIPNSPVDGRTVNLVDDDLPTQQVYADLVSARMETPPSIPIPWPVIRTAAGLLKKVNDVALGGRAKFPGIAVPDRLHARFKPLQYTNQQAKDLLDWTPRYSITDAIDRSIEAQHLAETSG